MSEQHNSKDDDVPPLPSDVLGGEHLAHSELKGGEVPAMDKHQAGGRRRRRTRRPKKGTKRRGGKQSKSKRRGGKQSKRRGGQQSKQQHE